MSDTPQGPAWWQASDQRWYPPESHPDHASSLPPPPQSAVPVKASEYEVQSADEAPKFSARRAAGLSAKQWVAIAACVLYLVSPVDLLPEALIGPFGLPDDFIAVLVALRVFISGRRD